MHVLISVTESLSQIYRKVTLQNTSLDPPPTSLIELFGTINEKFS